MKKCNLVNTKEPIILLISGLMCLPPKSAGRNLSWISISSSSRCNAIPGVVLLRKRQQCDVPKTNDEYASWGSVWAILTKVDISSFHSLTFSFTNFSVPASVPIYDPRYVRPSKVILISGKRIAALAACSGFTSNHVFDGSGKNPIRGPLVFILFRHLNRSTSNPPPEPSSA